MKTDVLLSHVHNNPDNCKVFGGFTRGEYTVYAEEDQNKPVILILGGSTSLGFYQHFANGLTWPKYFSELIKNEFFILNGAIGGYSSLQELLKVIRDAPRIKNLHTIISLNGINELPDYQGIDSVRKINYPFLSDIQYEMNNTNKWKDQRVPKFMNLMERVMPNFHSLFVFLLNNNKSVSQQNVKSNLPNAIPLSAAERWELNVRRIYALANEQGVKYFVFLQPTLGLSGDQSIPSPKSNDEILFNNLSKEYLTEIRNLYRLLISKCNEMDFCIDISDVANPTGNNYKDARHHNENGNLIIAKKIYDELKKTMRE